MKTRKYKTIEGLLRQCAYKELNFNDFNARTFYHEKSRKWCKFSLPFWEETRAAQLFASAVYNRVCAKQEANILFYSGKSYGMLNRLKIQKKHYDKTVRGTYCAGQDYDSEIRTIQKILR